MDEAEIREKGLCGVTFIGATGIEWVCIRPVHDVGYDRKRHKHKGPAYGTGANPNRGLFGQAPQADRHEFVRRWPNRKE